MPITWREKLAREAGFFDGEGSTTAEIKKYRVVPFVCIKQAHREVLDRFRRAVGTGKVYGPYQAPGNRKPHWLYRTTNFESTQAVVAMLWTWLGSVKRKQAKDVMLAARSEQWTA